MTENGFGKKMRAIRLSAKELAALSGVHAETIRGALRGSRKSGLQPRTRFALNAAIDAEGRRLLEYLIGEYGLPEGEGK